MTTGTVVFAMIPLALKFGAGSESRAPMAVVVLGGLLTSTVLTLVLVPVMYTYLDDLQELVLGNRGPRWAIRRLPWSGYRRELQPAMAGVAVEGGAGTTPWPEALGGDASNGAQGQGTAANASGASAHERAREDLGD